MLITVLEAILAICIRIILNTLFIHCFLPFKSKFSKRERAHYLLLISALWIIFELVRIFIENSKLTVVYGGEFVLINAIRSLAMMYSVTYLFHGNVKMY